MKILICEDDPTLMLDLWQLLHGQGHSVCGIARSTDDCMDTAATSRPDLVMVDEATQGGLSGASLVETLTCSGIPAVLLSADPQSRGSATSAGAVLGIPFTEAALASVMARVGHLVGAQETAA
jgi:DNA-binding response OmpR family regulator